jgi:Flp pilus assembly pilin Flp
MPIPGAASRPGLARAGRQPVEVSMRALRGWMKFEGGQDLLEYSLLASLIALFAMAAVRAVGDKMDQFFWTAIANSNI